MGFGIRVRGRSRKAIRESAGLFRLACGADTALKVNLLEILEWRLPKLYPDFEYEILPDNELDCYAKTFPDTRRMYLQESVYRGVVNNVPRDRFTVGREIGHLVMHPGELELCRQHGTPTPVHAYEDSEWQANTFAAELLAPANLIYGMQPWEIQKACLVSASVAKIQFNQANSLLNTKRAK